MDTQKWKGDNEEPLLDSKQEGAAGLDNAAADDNAALSGPSLRPDNPDLVWEGTTWQACPGCLMCCAPLCCSVWQWRITQSRIDLTHGCCGGEMETLDLRRIIDLHFHRNFLQMCCGRGTIVIHSDNSEYPKLELTTFGTRQIFERLREAWSRARIATAVDHHGQHDHHDGMHHH